MLNNHKPILLIISLVCLSALCIVCLSQIQSNEVNLDSFNGKKANYKCSDGIFTWEKELPDPLILQVNTIKCEKIID